MKNVNFALFTLAVTAAAAALSSCQRDYADAFDVHEAPNESTAISHTLSNQRINAIAEDVQGHIWFGTYRGLNRWNADDYHQYYSTSDTTSLPDNQILNLYTDSKGRLWVSTIDGVALYTDKDNFKRISSDVDGRYPVHVIEDHNGNIYMAAPSSISKYNTETQRFETRISELKQEKAFGQECLIDRYGRLLVVDDKSLIVYDTENFQQVDSVHLGYEPTAMWVDPRNSHIWIAGNGKIDVFDSYTRKQLPTPRAITENNFLKNTSISIIRPWNNNVILFNSLSDGLFAYDKVSQKVSHQSEGDFPFDAPDFNINALFNDSKGNLWIGSYDRGFEVRHSGRKQFNNDNALNSVARNKSVLGVVCDSNDNLWICTLSGELIRYDSTEKTSQTVKISTPSGLVDPAPWAMHFDDEGHLWIASLMADKVYHCDPMTNPLRLLDAYDVRRPLTFTETSEGDMLISTGSDGMMRIGSDGKDVKIIEGVLGGNGFITGMEAIDDDNLLAVSFGHQLYHINAHTLEAKPVSLYQGQWEECIGNSTFIPTALYKDRYGLLWIGTMGNGLLCYDIATNSIEPKPGTACSDIAAIQEDRQGNLWVSTQNGLSKYDRTTGRFSSFYDTDGTGGNQYYDRAACLMSDGTLVFGGTHGLTTFNPMDVGARRSVPIVFEDLKIHNRLVSPALNPDIIERQMSLAPDINLNYKQNGFSISFAGLDYVSQERVHYFYKLEGHDKYWVESNNSREAYYANLDPGKYTFRVRIGNSSDSIMDTESMINIKLTAAPWLQWWAIIIYVLLVGAVAWAIWRLWTYLLIHRAEAKKAKLENDALRMRVEKAAAAVAAETDEEHHAPDADRAFMDGLYALMEAELSNSELDVNHITEKLRISRTKFYYKVKGITGESPATIFKNYKLKRASDFLASGKYTVSEIADMTGFSTLAHFSTSFKKHFGVSPTAWRPSPEPIEANESENVDS